MVLEHSHEVYSKFVRTEIDRYIYLAMRGSQKGDPVFFYSALCHIRRMKGEDYLKDFFEALELEMLEKASRKLYDKAGEYAKKGQYENAMRYFGEAVEYENILNKKFGRPINELARIKIPLIATQQGALHNLKIAKTLFSIGLSHYAIPRLEKAKTLAERIKDEELLSEISQLEQKLLNK